MARGHESYDTGRNTLNTALDGLQSAYNDGALDELNEDAREVITNVLAKADRATYERDENPDEDPSDNA